MKVLSLCDGISCGHLALDRAGIPVEVYYASEIKKTAIQVTQENYPDTIQLGDLTKISYKDGIIYSANGEFRVGEIDLVIFGSPCQTFSIAMKTPRRIGLEDKSKSGLFLECYRILEEVKPKYFFFENVASMKKEDLKTLSEFIGFEPLRIDSQLVAPCMRKRLYWTNIPFKGLPKKVDIKLQDILDSGYTDREKGRCLLASDSRPTTTPVKSFHRYYGTGFGNLIFKSEQHYKDCVIL